MRGKGCAWTRTQHGCDVRFYGFQTEDERAAAIVAGERVREEVLKVEPRATVGMRIDDLVAQVIVFVRVDADELACFTDGPTHTKAVSRARMAASWAMELPGEWSRFRTEPRRLGSWGRA